MKNLLLILSIASLFACNEQGQRFGLLTATGKNYYLSASGNDAADGLTPQTAWKTINKLNASWSNISAGDAILFKRGDTFFGKLTIGKSGTSTNPITIGAYGTGARPKLSGFATVTTWTSLGGNIYESTSAIGTLSTLNNVVIDNEFVGMGRYPNADAASSGYTRVDAVNSSTSITDAGVTSSTVKNYTGGTIVARHERYYFKDYKITNHSGTTLTYTPAGTFTTTESFWIQDHPLTLDQHKEWYYNPTTKKLRVYLSTSPAEYTIKAAVIDTVLGNYNYNYIHYNNIDIEGANQYGFRSFSADGQDLTDVDIKYSGRWGFGADACRSITLLNVNVQHAHNRGVHVHRDGANPTIYNLTNVTIDSTSMIPGGGGLFGSNQNTGLYIYTAEKQPGKSLVYKPRITNSGYIGLRFAGDSLTIMKAFLDKHDMILDDGGGIYTYGGSVTAGTYGGLNYGRVIDSSIVINSGNPLAGFNSTNGSASAYYTDDNSNGIIIRNSGASNNSKSGVFLHNPFNVQVRNVNIYNSGVAGIEILRGNDQMLTRNLSLTKNVVVTKEGARTTRQLIMNMQTTEDAVADTGTINWGIIDSNYYASPTDFVQPFKQRTAGYNAYHDFATRKLLSHFDDNTVFSTKTFPNAAGSLDSTRFEYNDTDVPKTISFPGKKYVDAKGNSYANSIVVHPWTTITLMADGLAPVVAPPPPVVINNCPPKVSVVAPLAAKRNTTITITAYASDTDGKIAKVLFYNGTTLIKTEYTAPYTFGWKTGAGTKTITAKAYDDKGAATTSAPVYIKVK